jgi:hypothetical protein
MQHTLDWGLCESCCRILLAELAVQHVGTRKKHSTAACHHIGMEVNVVRSRASSARQPGALLFSESGAKQAVTHPIIPLLCSSTDIVALVQCRSPCAFSSVRAYPADSDPLRTLLARLHCLSADLRLIHVGLLQNELAPG